MKKVLHANSNENVMKKGDADNARQIPDAVRARMLSEECLQRDSELEMSYLNSQRKKKRKMYVQASPRSTKEIDSVRRQLKESSWKK